MAKRLVVWLKVKPEDEERFTKWYQDEYIPRFVWQVPGIVSISRWRSTEAAYLTVYELDPATDWDALLRALRSPSRASDREEWHHWETSNLTDFRDGFFEMTFEYRPGPAL